MRKIFVIIFIASTFYSFKQKSNLDTNLLCKTWRISKVETNGLPVFRYSVSDSIGNSPAYSFSKSGRLVVCQNVSWCPVGNAEGKYETVKGKWKFVSDSVIELKHKQYGRESSRRFRVLKLTEKELVLGLKRNNGV